MRLRTTLGLAFVSLSALQVAAVVPLALRNLNQTLSRQLESRIDGVEAAARAALERSGSETSRAMDELAGSDAFEKVARDLRQEPAPPALAGAARALMQPRGLNVLSLFDEKGRTLSSGHLPARLGDPDEALFAATRGRPGALTPVQVELRDEAGLTRVPALVTARALDYGDRRIWAVGGVLFDDALARHLATLTSTRVEVWTEGRAVASAGSAAAPTVARTLPFPPAAELRLLFSRADLLDTEAQVLRAFMLLFGLGLGAAVLVGLVASRRITRPVEALTAAATRIASGALDAQVVEKASGEVAELVGAFNRMTSDLERTTRQLVASERIAAWQEVARRLAHEIKNPLTPIQMSLETLLAAHGGKSPRFDALFEESAHLVLEEVERLRRIVDEFSRFARLPKPQLAPIDLAELAGQVAALYASPPPGVALDYAPGPPVPVAADRDQVTQVLVNLVKNAVEAMPKGGRVTLRVGSSAQEAFVSVTDTGPGIKPEDRGRVFEPYFTSKEGGTGLGLAIAARICQEHGGRLDVGGEYGHGAVFTVALPR